MYRVGDKAFRLTILGVTRAWVGRSWVLAYETICECGTKKIILASNLKPDGTGTKSCGCFRGEGIAHLQHGHARSATGGVSKTYRVWSNLKTRATNPNSTQFAEYMGRGIGICARWLVFENFLADMGECPPGLTIERRNNDEGYSPENCYWATKKQQANNRRSSHYLTYNGITQTMAQWADELKRRASTLYARARYGWSDERIITEWREPRCL